jgi:hypothetical protein
LHQKKKCPNREASTPSENQSRVSYQVSTPDLQFKVPYHSTHQPTFPQYCTQKTEQRMSKDQVTQVSRSSPA